MSLNDRLIEASRKGDIVKVKSLLKEGADVNAKDDDGVSSLIFASSHSNNTSSLDTVRLLLKEGADVNEKEDDGESSLMYASRSSNSFSSLDTVKLLINEGADVNAENDDGWSSLMYASGNSNGTSSLATVKLLISEGADVNTKDDNGMTSLMTASGNSNGSSSLDTVRLLLDNGADPFFKNDLNKYPLDYCPTISCKKIISNAMWKIMNKSIKKSAKWFSDQPETPISLDIWELILLRSKQRQLCKDLSKEENKYVLQGFATMLNIPIIEKMTKRQLCNLVSKQLSQGGKYTTSKKNIGTDIIKLAKFLGINTDQSTDKILDDIFDYST